jgi:low temperature requirement protein LtrA
MRVQATRRVRIRADSEHATVNTLELFFDLVFVFALTQVTAFMADNLTWQGLLRGVLIIGLLWWAWTGYAWLANVASADEPEIKLGLLLAMSAMFVLALTIPEAFDDAPGGLNGPIVLALCYLLVRVCHFGIFLVVAQEDDGLRAQLGRFAPSVVGSTVVLLVASQFSGWAQTGLWALALVADYVGTALGGAAGWRLPAPDHFSERHGLIVIVALGESIVAIGVGVAELPISWPIILASGLGLALVSAMWWAYFDVSALLGEHALASEPGEVRPRLGRNAFSFDHFPLIVGIVAVALGLNNVLEYVGDAEHHALTDPLKGVGLAALVGGTALYLLAHVEFKWLTVHTVSTIRLAAAGVLLLAWPLLPKVPAMGQLAVVAAVLVITLVVESVLHAEDRRRIRAELAHH